MSRGKIGGLKRIAVLLYSLPPSYHVSDVSMAAQPYYNTQTNLLERVRYASQVQWTSVDDITQTWNEGRKQGDERSKGIPLSLLPQPEVDRGDAEDDGQDRTAQMSRVRRLLAVPYNAPELTS